MAVPAGFQLERVDPTVAGVPWPLLIAPKMPIVSVSGYSGQGIVIRAPAESRRLTYRL